MTVVFIQHPLDNSATLSYNGTILKVNAMIDIMVAEICLLDKSKMQELAVLLAKSKAGEDFNWYLETAIYDKQLVDVEVQEPVC